MAPAGLTLGPLDPDSSSQLTARVGVHNKGDALLRRHRANWPQALTLALARERDEERTDALDMDEVEEVLRGLKGRRAFFGDEDTLEDAAVRGNRTTGYIVAVVYRKGGDRIPEGFGRSAQGVFPYSEDTVPKSIRAYEVAKAKADAEEAGKPVLLSASAPADDQTQALLEQAQADAAEAQRQRDAAEAASREKDNQLQDVLDRLRALENPEPFEGYGELNARDRAERVREGGVNEFGTAGLAKIREAEERRDQPSRQVLAAVEEALASTSTQE